VLGEGAQKIFGEGIEFMRTFGATEFLAGRRFLNNAWFTASVLPVPISKNWLSNWEWDGENWFLHRKCLRRPWIVLKCPVCYFEQFWCVTRGDPEDNCVRCGFKNKKDASQDLAAWRTWAAEMVATMHQGSDDRTLYDQNLEIYSAVCEGTRDAVSGHQPSTLQEAILTTLTA
jgi:hypothetical protein